jgi:HK97 family phage portal protein
MAKSPTLAPYVAKAVEVEEVLEHPFLDLLTNVNDFMNGFDLKELLFLSLDVTGNTFWYVGNRNNLGQPQEIWPQFTQFMKIIPDRQKFISHYEFSVDNMEKIRIEVKDIVQFKFASLKDAYWGLGPLQSCVLAADLSAGMNEYENSLMANRAMPDFAIVYPVDAGTPGEPEQKRQDKQWFKRFGGKKKAGKPVHLYGGADIKPLSLSPKELNFLQGRRATLNEIAAVFGVPISKLTTEDVNRANAEAGDYSYMKDTILPRLRKVEQKINEKLIPMWDTNLFCAFDNPVPEDKDFELKKTESNLRTGLTIVNEERECTVGRQAVIARKYSTTRFGGGGRRKQKRDQIR